LAHAPAEFIEAYKLLLLLAEAWGWLKPTMGGSNRKKTRESSKPVTNRLTAGREDNNF